LKKILGRSPDVGDAFTLSVWEPLAMRQEADAAARGAPPPEAELADDEPAARRALNPYSGHRTWRGGSDE
jgi:hypothetical protein